MFNLIIIYISVISPVFPKVHDFTGHHTKVAWVQDQGAARDPFARGSGNFKLMGLDTRDRKGERALLDKTGNYCQPIITPDGLQVVYSDVLKKKVYVVNWDGTGRRFLGPGFAADVWQDPSDGTEWVYVQPKYGNFVKPMKRVRLDAPGTEEPVWGKTQVGWNYFQVSHDGKRAAAAFPWPHCGMAELPDKSWKKVGRGCWTSISPDPSCKMWIFDGAHRNLDLYDGQGTFLAKVDIHNAPGVRGWEVYHPKWSNHPRFITMTGPYDAGRKDECKDHNCGNLLGKGAKSAEVYIGKFNKAYNAIEQWVQVTKNKKGDFYPDVWIDPGLAPSFKCTPPRLKYSALPGSGNPPDQAVVIYPVGGHPLRKVKTAVKVPWLKTAVKRKDGKITVVNSVLTTGLKPGEHRAPVEVRSGKVVKTYLVSLRLAAIHRKVNCGPNKVEGWEADGPYVLKGVDFAKYQPVSLNNVQDPAPERLYQTCRHQGPAFRFPDLPDGSYLVRLHFSDPAYPATARESSRRMVVKIEGETVLKDYDIVSSVNGGFKADIKEFLVGVEGGDGLTIDLHQGTGEDAFVCGIEIISK